MQNKETISLGPQQLVWVLGVREKYLPNNRHPKILLIWNTKMFNVALI